MCQMKPPEFVRRLFVVEKGEGYGGEVDYPGSDCDE